MRNLEPKWVPEQCGDGKPVGQRTDHAGLGGRAHVAQPTRPTLGLTPPAGQEDHRRTNQETQRHGLHAAQFAEALGVRLGIGPG